MAKVDPVLFWQILIGRSRPGAPRGPLIGWWFWEQLEEMARPWLTVPDAPYGLLKLRFIHYTGPAVTLPDSTVVRSGAPVARVHLDNELVLQAVRLGQSVLCAARADLTAIAKWIEASAPEIVALHGRTIVAQGAARLGFHWRDLPVTWRTRSIRLHRNGILALYSLDGLERLRRGRTLRAPVREIWMSRHDLITRYASRRLS